MTTEERLKMLIGDLIIGRVVLETRLEELETKVKELETQRVVPLREAAE